MKGHGWRLFLLAICAGACETVRAIWFYFSSFLFCCSSSVRGVAFSAASWRNEYILPTVAVETISNAGNKPMPFSVVFLCCCCCVGSFVVAVFHCAMEVKRRPAFTNTKEISERTMMMIIIISEFGTRTEMRAHEVVARKQIAFCVRYSLFH